MRLLCLEELTKRFSLQDLPALDTLSLNAEPGEIIALLGPSGSGKTTLLRLAAGLESPDAGKVFLNGERVAGNHVGVSR